jgi:hypothetical protein
MVIKGSELIEQVASINSRYDILRTHFLQFKSQLKKHSAVFNNQNKLVINRSTNESEFQIIFCDRLFSFNLSASFLQDNLLTGQITFSEVNPHDLLQSTLLYSFFIDEHGNADVEKPEETQKDINITYAKSAVYLTAMCLMKAFDQAN